MMSSYKRFSTNQLETSTPQFESDARESTSDNPRGKSAGGNPAGNPAGKMTSGKPVGGSLISGDVANKAITSNKRAEEAHENHLVANDRRMERRKPLITLTTLSFRNQTEWKQSGDRAH
jgi:hypothetical protein